MTADSPTEQLAAAAAVAVAGGLVVTRHTPKVAQILGGLGCRHQQQPPPPELPEVMMIVMMMMMMTK
jgi:hypothetical protein